MSSRGGKVVKVITSPKSVNGDSGGNSPNGQGQGQGQGQQCLCSPTTHQGSFRCRFHRSASSANWFKRSKSLPNNNTTNNNITTSLSGPKLNSVEST